ncbi:uncharacterized protein NECHADRAFT_84664 [Fusarium vanettenii 77-13-4]|uniref:Uncharacterized protein n=1 Tax=Fusarium vanettenii (strain ATCC MYA-4622 / CBS 123669 / FGSC 9596 / NRRL 45880 / 77-13-4) TaxID=660122 RepID=C7YTQ5_FUSV7|nr:uncharacterized protein NECHADRAFT_84664 [Fusarium vanettenii 77-13-4]EEU44285.1 hypothetical protein NECHADRAFT_84664 [Fusarium vanettenii 77-13-4]
MAPANSKANYKTYEAQARMVRAIVAAHPEVKWNYKEIVACYGSDMTEHALNHRFRRVRAQASIISEGRARGLDIKELSTDENILPATQGAIDKNSTAFPLAPALMSLHSYLIAHIAKYFGQSTADGIQFQFRTIKKDAEALRQTANDGGDVANCLNLGVGSNLAPGTPSKPTPSRSQPGSRSGKGAKRKVAVAPVSSPIKRSLSDDEGEDDELNFDEMDVTPSKRAKTTGRGPTRGTTPSRSAAVKAAATIAEAAQQQPLSSGSSPEEMPAPIIAPIVAPVLTHPPPPLNTIRPQSLFGDVERKPRQPQQPRGFMTNHGMTNHGSGMGFVTATTPWPELSSFSSNNNNNSGFITPDDLHYMNFDDGEGEI